MLVKGVTGVMTRKRMLAMLAACAVAAAAGAGVNGDLLAPKAHAQSAGKAKTKGTDGGRSVELRRGGYYSYGVEDGAPKSNLHLAPMYGLQSRAGPFDSGFFFDSGLYPHYWNNTPYPN
jgi:hypothetical protein